MPSRRSLLASSLAVALGATALPACAAGNLVDLQVVDRTQGNLLVPYRHRGSSYVAGQPGNRYAVQLTNRTGARVLVVLSVDGVNAISGETAAFGQTGYVLGPWQSTEITGWRKSSTEAAAFYFTSLADSYAARTDRPDNVGVIGAAVFRERVVWRPQSNAANGQAPASARKDAPADARARAPARAEAREAELASSGELRKAERLGTGHGEREYAPITQVAFERAGSEPDEIVRLRYDSRGNLVALGVIGGRPAPSEPDAFPRYVPDPR